MLQGQAAKTRASMLPQHSLKIWLAVAIAIAGPACLGCRDSQQAVSEPSKQPAETRIAKPVEPPTEPPPGVLLPKFQDIASAVGIDFKRFDDIHGLHRIVESNGGGVALFDFDNDGWLDVFFTNGCKLPVTDNASRYSNQMFRGADGQSFVHVTEPAGLTSHSYAHGCTVGDYDNDGFDDLYVTAFGRNQLWRNNGDGTLSDVTEETGTDVAVWSSSAAFADVNRDGNLDLYVVNYVKEDQASPKLCQDAASPDGYVTCPPTVYRAENDVLFLGDGEAGFRDATAESGITGLDGKGLGIVIFDANLDTWPDIYIANDGMPNFLYMNHASANDTNRDSSGVIFQEQAALLGCAVNSDGKAESSMGVACGDVDGDGRSDLFLTHFYTETNTLYQNQTDWFEDITRASGLGPSSRQLLGFGTEFVDYDNNGQLDLFIANGHIDDMSWGVGHPPYKMPPQFFVNRGQARFVDVSHWSGEYFSQGQWLGRGVAAGDIDNDGDLDLAVSHQLDRSALLRNDTAGDQSVIVKFIGGTRSNRSAIGSRVEVTGFDTKYVREVIGGGSYQSSSDRRVHLGLAGKDVLPGLRVVFPSGTIAAWQNVPAGIYFAIEDTGELIRSRVP